MQVPVAGGLECDQTAVAVLVYASWRKGWMEGGWGKRGMVIAEV